MRHRRGERGRRKFAGRVRSAPPGAAAAGAAGSHLDLEVGQAEGGAEERAEVRDGRDFPPGAKLVQRRRRRRVRAAGTGRAAAAAAAAVLLRAHLPRPPAARPPAQRCLTPRAAACRRRSALRRAPPAPRRHAAPRPPPGGPALPPRCRPRAGRLGAAGR